MGTPRYMGTHWGVTGSRRGVRGTLVAVKGVSVVVGARSWPAGSHRGLVPRIGWSPHEPAEEPSRSGSWAIRGVCQRQEDVRVAVGQP